MLPVLSENRLSFILKWGFWMASCKPTYKSAVFFLPRQHFFKGVIFWRYSCALENSDRMELLGVKICRAFKQGHNLLESQLALGRRTAHTSSKKKPTLVCPST
jgi:hypothetical protein